MTKVKISNSNAFTLDESTGGAAHRGGMPATPEEKADKSLHRILETDSDVSETDNEIDSDEADNGTNYRFSKRNTRTTSNNSEKLIDRISRSMSHSGNQETTNNNKKSDGIYLPGAKITAYATSIF